MAETRILTLTPTNGLPGKGLRAVNSGFIESDS